jgi:hypothetical protein
VWRPGSGLTDDITIDYVDEQGRSQTTKADRIFIPDDYPAIATRILTEQNKTKPGVSSEEFRNFSRQDIAFIVPQSPVNVKNTISMVSVLLFSPYYPEADLEERHTGNWSSPDKTAIESAVSSRLAKGVKLEAIIVGQGRYYCDDYRLDVGCKIDHQLRWSKVPVLESPGGRGDTAPWLWCTGRDPKTGVNPALPGDSGGPVLVRSVDGRWLFAGHTSGGDTEENCASSILMHKTTFERAAAYISDHGQHLYENGSIILEQAARRFVREIFESWSQPNEFAIKRLHTLYPPTDPNMKKWETTRLFYGRKRYHHEIVAEKVAAFTRWPSRRYEILDINAYNCSFRGARCQTFTRVAWEYENKELSKRARGTSTYEMLLTLDEGFWSGEVRGIEVETGTTTRSD